MQIIWTVLQIVGMLTWQPQHHKAENLVFQSQAEMEKAWVTDGGAPEQLKLQYDEVGEAKVFTHEDLEKKVKEGKQSPRIDFDKHTVLAVFSGQKPGGGYDVKIERVLKAEKQDETTIVLYRQSMPAPGMMSNMMITYPSCLVVIAKTNAKFEFVEVSTEKGKALLEATNKK